MAEIFAELAEAKRQLKGILSQQDEMAEFDAKTLAELAEAKRQLKGLIHQQASPGPSPALIGSTYGPEKIRVRPYKNKMSRFALLCNGPFKIDQSKHSIQFAKVTPAVGLDNAPFLQKALCP